MFASSGATPEGEAQQGELLRAVKDGIAEELTPRQREVLVALALNGVPIDVLAERMGIDPRRASTRPCTTRARSCARTLEISWR